MVRLLSLALLAPLAAASVSNIHIPQLATTIAINLPPNSNDVNFYMVAPTHYTYVALGFGSSMANSFMLIAYPAADGRHMTVSPRLGTGNTEPQFDGNYRVWLNGNSTVYGSYMIASGTCFNCRSWPGGSLNSFTTSQPMMYALGPSYATALASNDQGVTLQKHEAYGRYLMSTIQATGYGGTGVLTSIDNQANTGTQPVNTYGANSPNGVVLNDRDGLGLAHGIVLAIAALVLAPVDILLGSGRLLARFPLVHALGSLLYLLLLVAGLGTGVRASFEYVATRHFATAHQVIGFITFFMGLVLLGLGMALHVGRALSSSGERGIVAAVHTWGTRFLWVLLLIDGGLGLKLADASLGLVIGYAVLSGITFLAVVFVLACLWCVGGRKARARDGSVGDRGSPVRFSFNNRKSVNSRKTSGDSEPVIIPENRHAR
ncbi:hypothetical protein SPBR_08468 [Sporothrix brasiliensis 5110]|uniref:DOMON domain-containing protein n=1 Tax=Sporothrix brasiliensis 5110 TaxID=1398154 RepID=A0A0C2IAX6_9PEZI|nr:uncharacterized protein SPBR_08468 [Sporothrix brasiliensis 5110]KIH86401.1 hypothetical protein SPBR_08468 [Sporothrix brasiliensis 5110]